jgi:adenine-specific DNA glycosylase
VAVQRVVARVGYETARTPREAVLKVKELARSEPTLSPDEYVRSFARVGHTYCYPSMPECGPCPLLRTCRLGSTRLARGEVRPGKWGQRAA